MQLSNVSSKRQKLLLYIALDLYEFIDLNISLDLIKIELVSRFNLEYYRRLFVLIFLSECVNLSFIRIILVITFYEFIYIKIFFCNLKFNKYILNLTLFLQLQFGEYQLEFDTIG